MKNASPPAKSRQFKLEKIYEVSLSVFARFGFKKATVEDIAKELDMTKGNIYLYAKSKRDLYEKSILHVIRKFQNFMVDAFQRESDVVKKIVSMARAGFEFISHNEDFRRLLANDPDLLRSAEEIFSSQNVVEYSDVFDFSKKMLKNGLTQGIAEKRFRNFDADYIADLLSQIYMMFIRQDFAISEETSQVKKTEEIVNLILFGIVNDIKAVSTEPVRIETNEVSS
jgi:AcrR family transcriptional regulator